MSLAGFAPEAPHPVHVAAVGYEAARTDTPELITAVYRKLGVFTPEAAEKAPELLKPAIANLRETHASLSLEPFVAIELTERFGLRALVAHFDKAYNGHNKTFVWPGLWSQYDLVSLNRRTIDGQSEPTSDSLRGHVLTIGQNQYNEPGLVDTNKNMDAQRDFAKNQTLLNVTDWLLLEAMRRENGQESFDTQTVTRFPQMEQKTVGGVSFVGFAGSGGRRAVLYGSSDWMDPNVGVRFSVGQKA